MQKRRIKLLFIGMTAILTLLIVLVEGTRSSSTQTSHSPSYSTASVDLGATGLDHPGHSSPIVSNEMGGGELEKRQPPPSPIPDTQSTPAPTNDNETLTQETIKEIYFPYEGLSGGIKKALYELFLEMEHGTRSKIGSTLYEFEENIPNYEQNLKDVRHSVWKVSISIAGVLATLILSLVVSIALKDGATSITGYAVIRESLLKWIIGVAAAASSFFLLEKTIDLSKALESAIRSQFIKSNTDIIHGIGVTQLANALIPSPAESIELGVLLLIILIIFSILLLITYTTVLTVSWFATKVITIFVVAIAPIVLIIGVLPPFRWLQGLWVKITTIAFILWPMNLLMLGIFSKVIAIFISSENASIPNTFFAYFIAVGVISIFIAINSIIGKLVYGSAIEIALKTRRIASTLSSRATFGSTGILLSGTSGEGLSPTSGGLAGFNQRSDPLINRFSHIASTQSTPTLDSIAIDDPTPNKLFGNLHNPQNELVQQINTGMSRNAPVDANTQMERVTGTNFSSRLEFESKYHSGDRSRKMILHTPNGILQADVSKTGNSPEQILRKMKKPESSEALNNE
jgi:hypothetical protein